MALQVLWVKPSSGSTGVDLQTKIEAMFNAPIDLSSIGEGTFFLEGDDVEVARGPNAPLQFNKDNRVDVFKEPGYRSLVAGRFEFEYYATDGVTLLQNHVDTDGTAAYYTKVIFTPLRPLKPLVNYTTTIVGTTGPVTDLGVIERTVFDVAANAANTGNGKVVANGGYRGSSVSTYTIEITLDGVIGQSAYRWRKDSLAWSPVSLTHGYPKSFGDGLSVSFSPEGSFKVGDKFTFKVKPRTFLSDIHLYTFKSGEQGVVSEPVDKANIVSRVAPSFSLKKDGGLAVVDTVPSNIKCNIDPNTDSVLLRFNKELDPTSLDTSKLSLYLGSPDGGGCVIKPIEYSPNNVFFEDSNKSLRIYLESPVKVYGVPLVVEVQ